MELIEIVFRYWPWPAVVLIIIFIFKKQISEILQRLKKLKISGTVLETRAPPEQPKKISWPQYVGVLKKSLEKEKRVNILFDEYMKLYKKYTFEQSFNVIYGTQIKLLEDLSKKGTLGEMYINLKSFHVEFLIRSGLKATTTMEEYLGFLESKGYIKYVGEEDERIVKITPHGNNFLSYIKEQYRLIYKHKHF